MAPLTPKQAQEELGITKDTLAKYRDLGLIPGSFQLPSGHWRYPKDRIDVLKISMDSKIIDLAKRARI